MQEIAKVAPFRAGAEIPYRSKGLLMILEQFSPKSRILAKYSENERSSHNLATFSDFS